MSPSSPSRRRRTSWLAVCLVTIAALCSCTSSEEPQGQSPQQSQVGQSVTASPSADRSGKEAATSPDKRFEEALQGLLSRDGDPSRKQVAAAIGSAGFAAKDTEVSLSTTPTGLDVDAVEAAVRVDGDCLFGQLRDGEVSVTVLPVLTTGHCFIGDRP